MPRKLSTRRSPKTHAANRHRKNTQSNHMRPIHAPTKRRGAGRSPSDRSPPSARRSLASPYQLRTSSASMAWFSMNAACPGGTLCTPDEGNVGGTGSTLSAPESPADPLTWHHALQHPDVMEHQRRFEMMQRELRRVRNLPVSDAYTQEEKDAHIAELVDLVRHHFAHRAATATAVQNRTHV